MWVQVEGEEARGGGRKGGERLAIDPAAIVARFDFLDLCF